MHPGVAAAIGAATGQEVRDAADANLAAFWAALAIREITRGSAANTGMLVYAGLAGMPYLLRRREWTGASALIERVVGNDESPGTVAAALPVLRRIAAATGMPRDYATLGAALSRVDPVEAGRLLRDALDAGVSDGDWGLASGVAGHLLNLAIDMGQLGEALDYVTKKADYTRKAGRGPWTQLSDQGQRLQILEMMGEHRTVLPEFDKLLARLRKLPEPRLDDESVDSWRIRESILDVGRSSALALEKWRRCLDLNAEILASRQQRGAGVNEVAHTRYNDAGPLIRLGRLAEASKLLRDCQRVFETQRDIRGLSFVFSARADLEHERGHPAAAVELAQTEIRLSYASVGPLEIAISHDVLAGYLRAAGTDPAAQRAHRLAAALIYRLTEMTHDLASIQATLASEIRADRAAPLPATLAAVIQVTGQTEGVRLGELIATLQPDIRVAEQALAQILHDVR
jgi:tetratricopeptide (TPR) repeat protein